MINQIIITVCKFNFVDLEMFFSKTRKQEAVIARQEAMYFCRKYCENVSMKIIGKEIGGKDHSTVIHSCKVIQNRIETDKVFKKEFEDLEMKIYLKLFVETITPGEKKDAIIQGLISLTKKLTEKKYAKKTLQMRF